MNGLAPVFPSRSVVCGRGDAFGTGLWGGGNRRCNAAAAEMFVGLGAEVGRICLGGEFWRLGGSKSRTGGAG